MKSVPDALIVRDGLASGTGGFRGETLPVLIDLDVLSSAKIQDAVG